MPDLDSTNEVIVQAPSCPVGEIQCAIIEQLVSLRLEVDTLAEQVRTDTLTGLYNFRHFRLTLEQEMERTRRTEQTTALLMVDLDHFKQVNDKWGHETGNLALVSTAKNLRQTTRRLDIPCRYGGEEFAIILPATDLITAVQVAERIRLAIENTSVMVDGKDINLTASLGVAIYQSGDDDTPEQVVSRADNCLYRAKQQGRNQVFYEPEIDQRSQAAVSREERDALSGFFGDIDSDD